MHITFHWTDNKAQLFLLLTTSTYAPGVTHSRRIDCIITQSVAAVPPTISPAAPPAITSPTSSNSTLVIQCASDPSSSILTPLGHFNLPQAADHIRYLHRPRTSVPAIQMSLHQPQRAFDILQHSPGKAPTTATFPLLSPSTETHFVQPSLTTRPRWTTTYPPSWT
ncbi:uncharacterized protein AB9X84_018748 [Acanthopagrus schlegelii]